MKKLFAVMAVVVFCAGLACAAAAKGKEDKKEGGAPQKMVLMNFSKGDQFSLSYADVSLVEEHLTGKEKARMKVAPRKEKTDYNGAAGMFGMSKCVDWSKSNYVTFNIFVEGDKPWQGCFMVGDKASYAKWGGNYTSVNVTLKPGENKDVHVGIQGLFCSEANRPLDMANIQVFELFPFDANPPTYYIGNMYLVYEEE
jgi:hypothetical protein